VIATTQEKDGVDAATLAKSWGIGIEAAKRTSLVTTQRGGGGEVDDPPKSRQAVQDK
jgi:hypothetical protein